MSQYLDAMKPGIWEYCSLIQSILLTSKPVFLTRIIILTLKWKYLLTGDSIDVRGPSGRLQYKRNGISFSRFNSSLRFDLYLKVTKH